MENKENSFVSFIWFQPFKLVFCIRQFEPTHTASSLCAVNVFVLSLLLALVLVKLRNTCKKEMNRKKLERPNICYVFEKLVVQGWQIWHSQVSIPFNSSPGHSTRPQNAKKSVNRKLLERPNICYIFEKSGWKPSTRREFWHLRIIFIIFRFRDMAV